MRAGMHVDLDCMTCGAKIYYTLDGSMPTEASPCYERMNGLVLLPEVAALRDMENEGMVVVRAFAQAPGWAPSDTVTFRYFFRRRPSNAYISTLLRPLSQQAPAILQLADAEDDKMYLLVGTERALLVDAGIDREGDLAGYVRGLIGDMPCDVVITHGHFDHYGQAWKLHQAGFPIYMNHADLELAMHNCFGYQDDLSFTTPLADGAIFELGNASLRCYTVVGHTSAGTVLVDMEHGDAFSGDALGSNGNHVPDAQLLHLGNPEAFLDYYFPSLLQLLRKTQGRIRHLYTGHNDTVVDAAAYLPVVEQMLQDGIDRGDAARKPTLRAVSDGPTSSPTVLYAGNYRMAQDWAAVNVDQLFSDGLTSENLSLLAELYPTSGILQPAFDPHITAYRWIGATPADTLSVRPMSTRIAGITADGVDVEAGMPIPCVSTCAICVTAPDRKTQTVYTVYRETN
ncbi:MAG: MBL fold metallo-hydrolase [Butyricicoccus sp.]|nr:MBL fold metallo-hydrolase [Butyricicoccus sp.]